ncbi:Holliday junction branch migration protein RuvA [Helicobacter kayseriensis]|uniref:Holliday junction branch migration protein RuvA n=1 Tax=Helicobacter kayseriensis TaxID=2905877 RepID=UPI001E5BEC7F|nr:Holliday junction branch migration protein RuvA [Helicobacter kayseriensis]MCE3046968.1 Holliday junction branch migration protein RuvA [Helicobacter kayseriensis]MCE3048372.1 Holliday junction branch migration protein RuvA [Helicobacter kayseriensis]
MIVGLKGEIERIDPHLLVVDVHGVLYGVQVSLMCAMKMKVGDRVQLLVTEIVREDAYLLFGFLEKLEQEIFERLIKINGVGPKVALAILSTFSPTDFANIVESKNIQALQKVPGIGAKGASKIMVDLAGFFDFSIQNKQGKESQAYIQASQALENLGFKKSEIDHVLKKIVATDTPSIIKEALKLFQKK